MGSMDVTNPQTLNRYAYVLNNPLTFTDPQGLKIIINYDWYLGAAAVFGGGADGCVMDGVDTPCGIVNGALQGGGAVRCTDNNCGIGSPTPFTCLGSICGYMSITYATSHENDCGGSLCTDSEYQSYLRAKYAEQVEAQLDRVTKNLGALFGNKGSLKGGDPNIVGGHANFDFGCTDWGVCGPGRYNDGIHVECASGGYDCPVGSQLVVHDDTLSPWTSPFSFSNFNLVNFLEHGFVDLIGGTLCNCVFSH